MTSPIVKWAGGKTRLLPDLAKRMPARYRVYYEPFIGGGALFFHQRPPRAVLNDWNQSLVAMYEAVQDTPEMVIRSLRRMAHAYANERPRDRPDHYMDRRNTWNFPYLARRPQGPRHAPATKAYFAALLIFLNKTCFNGLWRVNSRGEFNVPRGDCVDATAICDAVKIRAASSALAKVTLRRGDYWNACWKASDGDFVYFDPPYDPVSPSSSFVSYTSDGFDRGAQELLAQRARELVANGAQVMLSNSDTKFIRSLYRGRPFTMHTVTMPRSINSNGSKRGGVAELIITGGY